MLVNGQRALAYIVTVDELKPIEGYDRVEYARTNGWWVVVSKADELKVGDKCVYFEIDSKVPDTDDRFKFLEQKHYRIKTQKMCKVYSQGLLMPLKLFPELGDAEVGTDVTEKLGITYYVAEDNERKKSYVSVQNYKGMGARHPRLFKTKPVRWLMRRSWGRKFLFMFFGKKKDKPLAFPDFISKTDEERIENMPWIVGNGREYVLTEKLDGTSCTYAMRRNKSKHKVVDWLKNKNEYEFFVCSRNVRQMTQDQKTYHDHNIYWDLAFKYNIGQRLKDWLDEHPECEWVCIQGEGVGSVQGNPLKLDEDDLYVFNFITSGFGRVGSLPGKAIIESWGMKWVPILGVEMTQGTMEEVKEYADGQSAVNPSVLREGIVYRSLDGKESFKNVSRKYLCKQK